MKKTIIAALFMPFFCINAHAESFSPQHDAVQSQFRTSEPTAKDALWTQEGIFKVAVYDDGTPRDGYADYVCLTLYENGFKGKKVWVQIIDWQKLTQDEKWKTIGEAHCQ